MVDPAKSANTPPVELPTRKIMRRDDGKSGTNTTANSQNPSKTTSEVGGSDGSNDGKEKDKSALTREEREARYREARERIFGSAESVENDTSEGGVQGEEKEKDASRSSSASGKKKNKKQRNDDDDFQGRGLFNIYYPHQYPMPGYTGDNVVYYNGMPGPMPNQQYPGMNPGPSPPPTYSNPYPVMMSPDAQPQYNWPGQQYAPPNPSMMHSGYGQMQNGYDLSADFQRGMSSFQNGGMPAQVTPKMTNPQMAQYPDKYQQPQHMSMGPAWHPMAQQPTYPMPPGSFPQVGPSNRPPSAPQAPLPGQFPYGQFPASQYNGKPNRNQHPIPGSYNRQQFNPQTQAFIPTARNMPYNPQQNMGQGPPMMMNGYGGYQMPGQNPMPVQMPRPSASTNSTPSFGSPQSAQGTAMNRIASQTGDQSSSQSSIAKYGTPSHLPAKPPAPMPIQQAAPKFSLPAPVARGPSSLPLGVVNNAPAISIRGGGGAGSNALNNTPS